MASVLADLVINLIGNDAELQAAVKRSTAALEKTASVSDSVKATMQKLGAGSAAALGIISAYSIKAAGDFQAQMELVHTQAQLSQSDVDALSKKVLALAPTVGVGPTQLAQGLYHIASAAAGTNMSAATMMDILTASAKESAMGLSDMQTTASALVATMVTMMPDVTNAADATAYLNQIVGSGNIRMQDLVNALGTGVLPAFKSAGLGLQDFGAAEATLTDMGEPATQAATRLRTTLVMMTHDTPAANKALAQIGLTTTDLAKDMSKPGGLLVAINDLKNHMKDIPQWKQNQILEAAFGGARVGSTIEALVQNSGRLSAKYQELGTTASRAKTQQEGWAAAQQTFKQQANELGAGLQAMAIQFGEKLLPILTRFMAFLSSHQGAMKAFFTVVIIGLTLMTAAWLAMSLSVMANPVFWIVAAIVAAVALLALGIYELVKHWNTVWNWIKKIALDVWHWLVSAWNATWNAIKSVVMWIWNNIIKPIVEFFDKYLVTPVKMYLKIAADFWKFVWGFMSVIFHDFMTDVKMLWNNVFAPVIEWVKGILIEFANWVNNVFIKPVVQMFHIWVTGMEIEWHYILKIINDVKGWFLEFWHWIDGTFIQPVEGALKWLADQWGKIWNGIWGVLNSVWSKIKPIFDKIQGAVNAVITGFKDLGKVFSTDPSGLGKAIAHVLGFEKGGTIPGSLNQPMLILAHGGEVILPNTVTQSIRNGQPINISNMSSGAIAASGLAPGGTGGAGTLSEFRFFIGQRELRDFSVQELQRRKQRNTSTGVT